MGAVHPHVYQLVEQRVRQQGIHDPYVLNLILLACREWDIYRREGGDVFAAARSVLEANLHAAHEYLHGHPVGASRMPAQPPLRRGGDGKSVAPGDVNADGGSHDRR